MGASYYATTALGLFLDGNDIEVCVENQKKIVEKKGCKHDLPEGAKFCPTCGKPSVIKEESEIDFEPWLEDLLGTKYEIKHTTDNEDMLIVSKKYSVRIGDINYSDENLGYIKIPTDTDVEKVRLELIKLLQPHGLWNDKHFKIWNIGRCSY